MPANILQSTQGVSKPDHTGERPHPEYTFTVVSTDGARGAALLNELFPYGQPDGVDVRMDHRTRVSSQ